MKLKILIVIIIVISVLLLFIIFRQKQKESIKDIKSIEFRYTNGYMINSDTYYKLECNNNCMLQIKRYGSSNEEEYNVDKCILNDIEKILNKYNVSSWDGFNKSDKNVLDGDSFSLSIETKDEKWIDASGYMKWPKNYSEVKGVFDSMIGSLSKVKEFDANDFKSMSFSYSNGGDIANSQEIYEINKKDDKYIATIKEKYKTEDEEIEVEVDIHTIYKALNIIDTYNVSTWDGFSEHDSNVLDGESFYFSLYVGDDKLTASGYMSWPKNYSKVKEEFTDLFHSLYEEGE